VRLQAQEDPPAPGCDRRRKERGPPPRGFHVRLCARQGDSSPPNDSRSMMPDHAAAAHHTATVEDWRAGRPILDRSTSAVASTSLATCGFPELRAPIRFMPKLRCLIPEIDGALFSAVWEEALWDLSCRGNFRPVAAHSQKHDFEGLAWVARISAPRSRPHVRMCSARLAVAAPQQRRGHEKTEACASGSGRRISDAHDFCPQLRLLRLSPA
jgi:hypothetical protein